MGLLRRRTTALAAGVSLVASAKASWDWTESPSVVPSSSDLRRGSGEGAQVFAEVSFPARWLNWFEQAIQQSDRPRVYSNERFSLGAFVSFTDEPGEWESNAVSGEGREAFWGLRGGKARDGDNAGDSDRQGEEEEWLEEAEAATWARGKTGKEAFDSSRLNEDQGASGRQRKVAFTRDGDDAALSKPWKKDGSSGDSRLSVLNSRSGGWSFHPASETSSLWETNMIEVDEAFDTDGSLVDSTGSESVLPRTEDAADELMHLEEAGNWAQSRRRLGTDSDTDDASYLGEYEVTVRAEVKAPSTSWGGAQFKLKVGTSIPSQEATTDHSIVFGEIEEGEDSPKYFTRSLERGCYVIFTIGGDRPYDVVWTVFVDEVEVPGASGGGIDWHTFGVGGALCGLSTCYGYCYSDLEESDIADGTLADDQCANYGDLAAPLTEANGANCFCEDDQLQLRLDCLNLGCDASQQCYNINGDAAEVTTADVVRIVIYMTFEESFSITSLIEAVSIWLDLDSTYVDLEYIGGRAQESDMFSVSKQNFMRMEFKVITFNDEDVAFVKERVAEGVAGFNDVLQSYEGAEETEDTDEDTEETDLSTAAAYTAECTVSSGEYVAVADMPIASIASSGGDVSLEGLSDDDEDETHFTRSAQFIFGALLVVVVAVALSIVACVVCCMKRKQRLDFERQNQPVNGAPKPVQVVDPWASVDRNFQKPTTNGTNATYPSEPSVTNPVMMNGSRSMAPNT